MPLGRREVLRWLAGALGSGSAACPGGWVFAAAQDRQGTFPPVRALTRGPKHHWFGYYDKREFDPTGRYVLGMEVGFEHRTPAPDDVIGLGMIDLRDSDRWIALGETRAWCWQQGCMLQWLPGSTSEVIWNDRDDGRFVCHILDVHTLKRRTLPAPIYAISPDGRWAIAPDFRRLHDMRPGYGYAGIPDPNFDGKAPDDAGLWRLDLATGKTDLLFSFHTIARLPGVKGVEMDETAKHWFNHLLVNPDGTRFAFLHRWRGRAQGNSHSTRLVTVDADGSSPYVLDPYGKTSHYDWRDTSHILAFASHPSHGSRFYVYEDRTKNVAVMGADVLTQDGHCTYLPFPGRNWILSDTYPDRDRLQHPYLFDVARGAKHPLGHFRSPPEYTGEWRCDTHPRFSPDGRSVVIDSPHGGNGRQLYLIDISGLVS